MEVIVGKISSYNILNNVVPGAIFCYLWNLFFNISITDGRTVMDFIVIYFIGCVLSRIGSIVIEPILKKFGIIRYADYDKYIIASNNDEMIKNILEVNNLYRSILSLLVIILISKVSFLVYTEFEYSMDNFVLIILLSMVVLFVLSYRKNTIFICKRVENHFRNK